MVSGLVHFEEIDGVEEEAAGDKAKTARQYKVVE